MLLSTILLLAGVIAPAPPALDRLVLSGSTSKSLQEFGSCFAAAQEKRSRPFWFVPNDGGGRFSNEGGHDVTGRYGIRFTEGQPQNRIEVSVASRGGPDEQALVTAVKSCW
ncbi:MAG: hypothetical protein ACM3ZV_07095 [Bacillota bacterium]